MRFYPGIKNKYLNPNDQGGSLEVCMQIQQSTGLIIIQVGSFRHLSSRRANAGLSENQENLSFLSFNSEIASYNVFFPAAGYRNRSNGSVNNVGSNGNYWSAVPNSVNNGYNLNFNSGNVNPLNNNNRANGFSVRPVQAFAPCFRVEPHFYD